MRTAFGMARTDDVIQAGMLVEVRYTIRDTSGKVLEGSGDGTERYRHGHGEVVPGLERALEGRRVGERLDLTLRPGEAYGPRRRGPGPQPIPRATFPSDAALRVGAKFEAETPDGVPIELFVTRIDARDVYVDTNHPLSGMTLRYEIEIVSVSPVA